MLFDDKNLGFEDRKQLASDPKETESDKPHNRDRNPGNGDQGSVCDPKTLGQSYGRICQRRVWTSGDNDLHRREKVCTQHGTFQWDRTPD